MNRRRNRRGRDVNGVLVLDKPSGVTSNEALQAVKKLFNARKAGHTGSLDKTATGLLPICFGEATKFSSFLLDADKHYRAVCRLGVRTTTGDASGDVIEELPVPALDDALLKRALGNFRGTTEQVPPMYSALKHKGQRLYKLAYQGVEVERQPREITIHELRLLAYTPVSFEIEVVCSKGTYIRTLAEDIGASLGSCAHVESLRRLGSGPYGEDDMLEISRIEELGNSNPEGLDNLLLGIDSALEELPAAALEESVAFYFRQGQAVLVPGAPTEGKLRVYAAGGDFLGLGEVLEDGRISPRRLVKSKNVRK